MKATESKTTTSSQFPQTPKASLPFFQKAGNRALFAKEEPQKEFFFKSKAIQPKLTIGQPEEPYEHEADTMAEKVVGYTHSEPVGHLNQNVQRKCDACEEEELQMKEGEALPDMQRKPIFESEPDHGALQMKCAACEQEEKTLQPKSTSDAGSTGADMSHIESSLSFSKGSGSPLPDNTRSQMEGAFGADFSEVRVHTGGSAVQMNRDLQAQAFTHGSDVYFNAGKYNTGSTQGKRLLGHELTHVVQQGEGIRRVQKQPATQTTIKEHGERTQMPEMPCFNHFNPDGTFNTPRGEQNIHFDVNSAGLLPNSIISLNAFRTEWRRRGANAAIELNGYASIEGSDSTNWTLSCNRAKAVEHELVSPSDGTIGIPNSFITVFANGETNKFSPSHEPNRIVTLTSVVRIPPEPIVPLLPKCGPDATNWFVTTVNSAMVDPRVLHIQTLLSRANTLLTLAGVALNTDRIAESGSTVAISGQLLNLGSAAPSLNPTISSQLAMGALSSSLVASTTYSASIPQKIAIASATALIAMAALEWKNLVNHGAPFDFKAHIMNHPHSPNCPDEGCVSRETGVITLCPGSAPENCYESDITGNIFYALIGRFIGWSELTLQLGSQLAELTDTRTTPVHPAVTWDTPDDTFGIHLGFGLPLPLTNADLCTAIGPNRSSLSIKTGCADCTETFNS
jgi:outer membrane protein OmpA-like peptidoglycan-associated protein